MKNKSTKRSSIALTDEQFLFAFVRRMEDLQRKKYFQELRKIVDLSKPPWDCNPTRVTGDPSSIPVGVVAAIKDEEVLISFLATFRQFYLHDEPIALAKVKGILRRKAELLKANGDTSLMAEFRALVQKHKKPQGVVFSADVTDAQGRTEIRLTGYVLDSCSH